MEAYKFDPVPVFDRLDSLEDHSRRNNLRIDGVPEPTRETWEKTAFEIKKIASKIGLEQEIKIDRAHRIGSFSAGERPRTIIARFHNYADRDYFLRNSHKLKGTRIYINEDLSQASLKRKEQLPLLQKARSEGKTAYFSHTRLIIKEKVLSLSVPENTSNLNISSIPIVQPSGSRISSESSTASALPTVAGTSKPNLPDKNLENKSFRSSRTARKLK